MMARRHHFPHLRGFTIVELVVVIATIGILASISLIGFSRFQADTRDARRTSSINIIAEALEKYYDANGEYPSCSAVSAAADIVTTDTLKGVSRNALIAPLADDTETNSIRCDGTDLTIDGEDFFQYQGDGSTACDGSIACLNYTLVYKSESDGTVKSLSSRRNTAIATSGAPTLSATSISFASATLDWTDVQNANTYVVQYGDSASFGTGTYTEQTVNGASLYNVAGLETGTSYFARVRATNGTDNGLWSNTLPFSTLALGTPSITATAASNSQIDVTWPAVSNATSYTIRLGTTSNLSSAPITSGITGTSYSATGLDTGVQYYFQVRANNGSYSGNWSAVDSAVTFVPVPTGLTATTNSTTQITASWNAVSVATSYRLEYSTSSSFSSYSTITGITGTSRAVTGLQQGTTWYFRVYALVDTTASNASTPANATTTLSGPSGLWIAAYRPNAIRAYAAGYWVVWNDSPAAGNWYYAYEDSGASCPSGSYPVFQYAARYNSPATEYYTGATTATTWYMVQPTSGYKIKFSVRAYCQGPNTSTGWTGWIAACAANPGSSVGCTF